MPLCFDERMTATDTHHSTDSARLDVDLLDPHFYQDGPGMHAAFSWMRANEPVYRDRRNGLWGITRHADLKDVERRSTVFLSSQGYRAIWASDEINMIAQDDPRHRQQRLLVQRPDLSTHVGVGDHDVLLRLHVAATGALLGGAQAGVDVHVVHRLVAEPAHRARGHDDVDGLGLRHGYLPSNVGVRFCWMASTASA